MKAFLDTSVLVATFYGDHEHHEASFALFLRQKKQNGFTATHCLAETWSVLTGMPGKNRASPEEALLFLGDVRNRLTLVALNAGDYYATLEDATANAISGGAIYDALLARCAMKTKVDAIYTWNIEHFSRFGRDVAGRVKTP